MSEKSFSRGKLCHNLFMIFLQHEHVFNIIYPYTKSINNECQHYLHNFLFHIADLKIGSPSFKNKNEKKHRFANSAFFHVIFSLYRFHAHHASAAGRSRSIPLSAQLIRQPRKFLKIQCLPANRERPSASCNRSLNFLFCKMQQFRIFQSVCQRFSKTSASHLLSQPASPHGASAGSPHFQPWAAA